MWQYFASVVNKATMYKVNSTVVVTSYSFAILVIVLVSYGQLRTVLVLKFASAVVFFPWLKSDCGNRVVTVEVCCDQTGALCLLVNTCKALPVNVQI